MAIFRRLLGYLAALLIVGIIKIILSASHSSVHSDHLTSLCLLAVVAVGLIFEIGPALLVAGCSLFLLRHGSLTNTLPHAEHDHVIAIDWMNLSVFIAAALLSGGLSARARARMNLAAQRELELKTLFDSSETISREVDGSGAVKTLSRLLREGCNSPNCLVWKYSANRPEHLSLIQGSSEYLVLNNAGIERLASAAAEHRVVIGFDDKSKPLWQKASSDKDHPDASATNGVYVPLTASSGLVGVLYVSPRADNKEFAAVEQRLILTLANHLAIVLARETLMEEAAQAAALRESDALKDSIVSLVSHELRSPLAAIKATASAAMIENGHTQTLSEITAQTDRLHDVLTNLLDLSRLDAGAWNPIRDWCDIVEIIGTCLDRLGDEISSRVNEVVGADLPLVYVDYGQIAVAISNLLENAAKYSPPGSPIEITVEAEHNGFDEIPTSISIRVTDHGKGIPTGEAERMFERFYRCAEHKNIGISGTGLGLALVKSIVDAHNGRVWCANNPAPGEHGAVFTISIPVE